VRIEATSPDEHLHAVAFSVNLPNITEAPFGTLGATGITQQNSTACPLELWRHMVEISRLNEKNRGVAKVGITNNVGRGCPTIDKLGFKEEGWWTDC
jgi:hypothetical protein